MPKIDLDALSDDLDFDKDPMPFFNELFHATKGSRFLVFWLGIFSAIYSICYGLYKGIDAGIKGSRPYLADEQTKDSLISDDWWHKIICFDSRSISPLVNYMIKRLRGYKIPVGNAYKKVLRKMAKVMIHDAPLKKPVILTAGPGLGKTEMLISTLIIRAMEDHDFSAIVVTRRINDAVRTADEVDKEVGDEVCCVRPSFALMTLNGNRCLRGYLSEDYEPTLCRDENCPIQSCPVKNSFKIIRKRRIIFITTEYLHLILDNDSLDILRMYKPYKNSDIKLRKYMFIDENPGMVFNNSITDKILNDCAVHVKRHRFDECYVDEFIKAKGLIAQLMGGKEKYEYVESQDTSFKLSPGFIKAWNRNPHEYYYDLPIILNELIEDGGIRQNGNAIVDYSIAVNWWIA